jgi:hypothetical protein
LCYWTGDWSDWRSTDTLFLVSYPDIDTIWTTETPTLNGSLFPYHSNSLFDSPQIMSSDPLIMFSGTNGSLSSVFVKQNIRPVHVTDFNNDGEDEIVAVNPTAIYHAVLASTGIEENSSTLPTAYRLYTNYPNPFNATTTIEYDLIKDSPVSIDIYDILGQKMETLVNDRQSAGHHQISWNASDAASGIYFYKIQAGDFTSAKKMLLLK